MATLDTRNPLMLPELLRDILDMFSAPALVPTERQALAALARTCRACSEPSLDRLWWTMYSLRPLIRCYGTSIDDVDNAIPPTSSQFAIIDRYSHRVRELTVSENTSVRFLQCTSMRPRFLFPNLTALRWSSPYISTPYIPIIFIQQLLSPTLVSLEATLAETDGPALLSFLENYPSLCRNLRSLEFHFPFGLFSETTTQALSRAIRSQHSLENLVLHAPIDWDALKYLSTLPTLRKLSVNLPEGSRQHIDDFLATEMLFCGAQVLDFTVLDLELVTSLLQSRHLIFHVFRLYHRGRQTPEALFAFLKVLTPRAPTTPLRELTLSFGDCSHPFPVEQMEREGVRYRLSYETLQPLTALGNLRELMIEWSEQISLDDDELVKLACNWPSLQVFNIYCGRGGYPPFSTKYATLRGLLSLVSTCTQLHAVSLPLDAREVPVVQDIKPCETNFTCLIVPESPIGRAHPVAEFLFTYLPYVTAVDARFLRPPGADVSQIMAYERAWQQVELRLEELHCPPMDDESDASD